MYDPILVAAYVSDLLAAPAPHESPAIVAQVRAAVLTVKLAYGVTPMTAPACEMESV